ncbi:MAG: sialidase family protein [Candidatus Ratteibacteria bacterium]|nr:sialidase family protein [Candidatus Ratteibacteria bacterium]
MENIIIYKDEKFYSAFPSIAKLNNGDLIISFRQAPQRKPYSTHIDSESKAVTVRSKDSGRTWSDAEIAYEEEGNVGIQDPSIAQLRDGTLIANFFSWQVIKIDPFNHYIKGTFVIRSFDNGKNWEKQPIKIEVLNSNYNVIATSESILELPDGEILIPLYGRGHKNPSEISFLMRSNNKGESWTGPFVIAQDPFYNLKFEEPSLCLLPSGKILCMMREPNGYLYQSESIDGGKSWTIAKRTDIWGYPANLLTLRDGRVLCTYGYRRSPYGVRGCLSYDGGKSWNLKNEIIIRSDGEHGDLGYPSSIEIGNNKILTVYYFHTSQPASELSYSHYSMPKGTRYIAGTFYDV